MARRHAFVIMQIGDEKMDSVYEQVIAPSIRDCGLEPRRVDKHNSGQLLKSEIVRFINDSALIVADLTNERPNCYLEVGYAMGKDRFPRLVLAARRDHNPLDRTYQPEGPRVHFDVSGYDICFWDPDDLQGYRKELIRRITRRIASADRREQRSDMVRFVGVEIADDEKLYRTVMASSGAGMILPEPETIRPQETVPVSLRRVHVRTAQPGPLRLMVHRPEPVGAALPVNKGLWPAQIHRAGDNPRDKVCYEVSYPSGRSEDLLFDVVAVSKNEPYRFFFYKTASRDAAEEASLEGNYKLRVSAHTSGRTDHMYLLEVDGRTGALALRDLPRKTTERK